MRYWFAILLLLPASADTKVVHDSYVVVAVNHPIPVTVDKISGFALVEPSRPVVPELNLNFAERAGLDGGRSRISSVVGPIELVGTFAPAWIELADRTFRKNVSWFGLTATSAVDMVIGAKTLPHQIVHFEFKQSGPDERTVTLPLIDFGPQGSGTRLMIGGSPVRIFFNLARSETLATAGAGSVVAAAHGGRLDGPIRAWPISFGVKRPVQAIKLERPLVVGPITLDGFGVRLADYGRTRVNQRRPDDPTEIVVTGRHKRDRSHDWIEFGRDALSHCSSLTMNKRRKTWTLSCR